MGVFEVGGIFEAIAEGAIEGDVADPDDGDAEKNCPVREVADREEDKWPRL